VDRELVDLGNITWFGEEEVFEFERREITQSRMKPLRIVEGLDVVKEQGLSVLEVKRDLVAEALGFECGPEAFDGGIIVTTARATHTGNNVMGVEQLTEGA